MIKRFLDGVNTANIRQVGRNIIGNNTIGTKITNTVTKLGLETSKLRPESHLFNATINTGVTLGGLYGGYTAFQNTFNGDDNMVWLFWNVPVKTVTHGVGGGLVGAGVYAFRPYSYVAIGGIVVLRVGAHILMDV